MSKQPHAHMPDGNRLALTRELAHFAARSEFGHLPEHIRLEGAHAFLNWMGCALSGSRESAVTLAAAAVAEIGGPPQASIIGHVQGTDIASAAFVNAISSSVLAFDDAHYPTVTHPSSPIASAVLAFSERTAVDGESFLNALVLGMEITCRLGNVLVLPPSGFNAGFYLTGLTAPIGAALALGKMMHLDEQHLNWAIGLGASQSGGFRATHGTMTAHFRPGHAARGGVWAALLAAKGFTSDDHALEADKGFLDVFAPNADAHRALDRLGTHFEILNNAYKPYPCGIVIHPTLDACLAVRKQYGPGVVPRAVKLRVHPLALSMCGIREPVTPLEANISLYHCAAAALLRGQVGLAEMEPDFIADPAACALRARIEAVADPEVRQDRALVEVTLPDGQTLHSRVADAGGNGTRRMTAEALEAKFIAQASLVLDPTKVEQLRQLCLGVASLKDVGREIRAVLHS